MSLEKYTYIKHVNWRHLLDGGVITPVCKIINIINKHKKYSELLISLCYQCDYH